MKWLRSSLIITALIVLTACATMNGSDDPAQIYKDASAPQIYNQGVTQLRKGNYQEAKTAFEALDSLYPFDRYTQKGQLGLIYAYYEMGDYPSTVAAANRYIHVYPRSKHVDYAYYMKAMGQNMQGKTLFQRMLPLDMSERNLTNAQQAFFDFRDLVQLFPDSKYAPDARQHMVYLRNLFAQHELETAKYYYARKAYVGAANRASYLIEHYQHTPQVEPALVLLVKANRAMNLPKAANDALKVLATNFPHSPELQKLTILHAQNRN